MIVENAEQAWEVLEAGDAYLITPREIAVQATILGGVVGGVVGYFAYKQGQKVMQAKYEVIMDEEIAQAKAFYSRLNKRDMETPERAKRKLHPEVDRDPVLAAAQAIDIYQGSDEETLVLPEIDHNDEIKVRVIMDEHPEADAGWDYEEEIELRLDNPDEPYVVHLDEFMENEYSHDQVTLTYYQGDDVLADERDEPIPYPDPIVGEDNLKKFGHGSGDPYVVLIRNERLSIDYEVAAAEGKFAYEVLGLEHSDGGARAAQRRKELRKFRSEPE